MVVKKQNLENFYIRSFLVGAAAFCFFVAAYITTTVGVKRNTPLEQSLVFALVAFVMLGVGGICWEWAGIYRAEPDKPIKYFKEAI